VRSYCAKSNRHGHVGEYHGALKDVKEGVWRCEFNR
jgi:hypothetical protein